MGLDQKRFFESGRKAERERIVETLTDYENWLIANGITDDDPVVSVVRNLRELFEGWD